MLPQRQEIYEEKAAVRDFWDEGSCGEVYAHGETQRGYYDVHAKTRYELEPYIHGFARFDEGRGKDVLEVGVGMGADHTEWARSEPANLAGVDLTPRAVEHTKTRLGVYGYQPNVQVGDAENLPFADDSFDIVYSWGVLHHSPDTPRAIREVHRVLRPGGVARVMIYHKHSVTGYLLWIRFALLAGRPTRSLADVYAQHLESPGTKAYSADEAREMFRDYSAVEISTALSASDLLEGSAGQRYEGTAIQVARKLWPRWFIRTAARYSGLFLMIEARK